MNDMSNDLTAWDRLSSLLEMFKNQSAYENPSDAKSCSSATVGVAHSLDFPSQQCTQTLGHVNYNPIRLWPKACPIRIQVSKKLKNI